MKLTEEQWIDNQVELITKVIHLWENGQIEDDTLKLNLINTIRISLHHGYSEGYNDCENDWLENAK